MGALLPLFPLHLRTQAQTIEVLGCAQCSAVPCLVVFLSASLEIGSGLRSKDTCTAISRYEPCTLSNLHCAAIWSTLVSSLCLGMSLEDSRSDMNRQISDLPEIPSNPCARYKPCSYCATDNNYLMALELQTKPQFIQIPLK